MTSAPTGRQLETLQRSEREEARDRRTIMKVHVAGSAVLIISTLLAWENHPRVEFHGGLNPGYYVKEVSHSIGLATRPAGFIVVAVAILSLPLANLLRRVHVLAGWLAFLLSLGALGTCCVEIIQLLLGRRNWVDTISASVGPSPIINAIGAGVWLATLASIVLVVNASTYVWLGHRLWGKHRALTD